MLLIEPSHPIGVNAIVGMSRGRPSSNLRFIVLRPTTMDTISPEQRSAHMSRIRSKDTKPEMAVRRLLHGLGYRYVLHDTGLPGRPDLVFPSRHKVVFVHGCFWHGHVCSVGATPKSNVAYWAAKIEGNKRRDGKSCRALRRLGWKVLTVRECATASGSLPALERRLVAFLD